MLLCVACRRLRENVNTWVKWNLQLYKDESRSFQLILIDYSITVAVSHEKGKITVLQLSALLKQADSAKKKLTLTRLSSAPIPFTVLSVTGNPCNEDFLAVCGLKVRQMIFQSIEA